MAAFGNCCMIMARRSIALISGRTAMPIQKRALPCCRLDRTMSGVSASSSFAASSRLLMMSSIDGATVATFVGTFMPCRVPCTPLEAPLVPTNCEFARFSNASSIASRRISRAVRCATRAATPAPMTRPPPRKRALLLISIVGIDANVDAKHGVRPQVLR